MSVGLARQRLMNARELPETGPVADIASSCVELQPAQPFSDFVSADFF
jgi:hypothetical protein